MSTVDVKAEKSPVREGHQRVNSFLMLNPIKIKWDLFKERVFGV